MAAAPRRDAAPVHPHRENTEVKLRMMMVLASATACVSHPVQQKGGDTQPAGAASRPVLENDRATGGSGLPSGYLGRTDNPQRSIGDAKYRNSGNRWEITTGPAHIMYSPSDTMKREFVVATTFDQMEAREHSDAFGIFVGGADLDQPSQRYTYFMVRGNGEYVAKVREGSETRDIVPWTPHQAVAKQDAEGRARYRLAIQVRGDSVRFLSNGTPVAAVRVGTVPTDGIAGLRVDQNVHVMVDRLRSTN